MSGVRRTVDVELRGLCKRYGAVVAVESLDLRVGPGEFVSLLGPSGCGKTTTLRAIAGLVRPDAGEVLVGGRVMNEVPVHRRRLGLVAQNYALFPHMTVLENVTFGLRMRGAPAAEIARRARGRPGHGPARRNGEPLSAATLGRPAAAGGAGALPRRRAGRPAPGRAAGRPGQEAARDHAGRAQVAAASGRDHDHLRDPRPGRGADHVGPDRRDAPGPAPAGRNAAGNLRERRKTGSWPISSACAISWTAASTGGTGRPFW